MLTQSPCVIIYVPDPLTKDGRMFNKLTIHLTSRICGCTKHSLRWGFSKNDDGKHQLFIQCKLCSSVMSVPFSMLRAGFEFGPETSAEKDTTIEDVRRQGHIKHNTEISEKDKRFLRALRIAPDIPPEESAGG